MRLLTTGVFAGGVVCGMTIENGGEPTWAWIAGLVGAILCMACIRALQDDQ